MSLNPDRTINGSYGQIFMGETWLANIQRMEGTIDIERKTIKMAGSRATGYKAGNTSGEGTITGFKVTSQFLRTVSAYMRKPRSAMTPVVLRYRLDDPESFGAEEAELTGVKFWRIGINFQVDELVEEAVPFTFFNMNILSCMDGPLDEFSSEGQNLCGDD